MMQYIRGMQRLSYMKLCGRCLCTNFATHVLLKLPPFLTNLQGAPNVVQLVGCNCFNAGVVLSRPSHDISQLLEAGEEGNRPDMMCALHADGDLLEDAAFKEVMFVLVVFYKSHGVMLLPVVSLMSKHFTCVCS